MRSARSRSRFSALQRAEIAEMLVGVTTDGVQQSFSALQRAEIAEIRCWMLLRVMMDEFQCSSTSRNC